MAETHNDRTLVTGLFPDRDSAERAYQAALARGHRSDDLDVVMSDDTRQRQFAPEDGAAAPTGLHGPLGLVVAALAAAGTTLGEPGLSLVLAGPLVGPGATAETVADVLSGWNIPDDRVEQYRLGLREGGILLGVQARDAEDALALEAQWRAAGGSGVHH